MSAMSSPHARQSQSPTELLLQNEMEATWQWRIDTDPELAASLGLLSKRRSKHAIDPRSPKSFQDRLAWVQLAVCRLEDGITPEKVKELLPPARLSYQLYLAQLTDYVAYTTTHKAYFMCINRLEGPHIDLPLYAKYLPLESKPQKEFYKDFLNGIPVQLDEIVQLLTLGLSENRTAPQVSFDGVVSHIRNMVDARYEAFSSPIENCETKHEDDLHWKEECHNIISDAICPAFSKLADFLEVQYIPNLRTEISASNGYPDGKKFYQDCLAFHTTTAMTASEIHQLGLDEVQRVKNEMEKIAAEAGFHGMLEEYMEHLRTSPEFSPKSEESLCAHYRDITSRIAPAMLALFHVRTLPRTPFQIVETPSAHASVAPAAYYLAGSSDPNGEARPGTFYVNTSELLTRRLYECESLALHEAIPGHHTQAAVQGENQDLPNFRRFCEDRRYFEAPCRFPFYTGYIEGWGLHSETLGEELGLYKKPSDKMGQLSMEALRCCRLVVDTGMHAFGWSADRALKYMLDNTAMGKHDAKTEVTRYITWPGQATAYKTGERVFHRLRSKASATLASSFDPRDFYDVVLQCGPVPLSTLESIVDDYIVEQTAAMATNIDDVDDLSKATDNFFVDTMTWLTPPNWCKCCIVPGACQV